MVNVSCELTYGSYHDVDSSEIAYKIAASQAFQEAAKKARPVILEPIMKVEVLVPEKYFGDITGSLSSKRAKIEGFQDRPGGIKVITRASAAFRNVRLYDSVAFHDRRPRQRPDGISPLRIVPPQVEKQIVEGKK